MREKVKSILPYIVIVIVVIIIRSFIVTPVRVNGSSMDDTLKDGDILILNRLNKSFDRFDIVVIDNDFMGEAVIKRIVGLPGEKVEIENGRLYINSEKLDDPYNTMLMEDYEAIVLGDDEYFILGDNREVSLDSRAYGPVNIKYIEGTSEFVLFPFNKFGNVN